MRVTERIQTDAVHRILVAMDQLAERLRLTAPTPQRKLWQPPYVPA